ncbi:hypothetical protein FO519_005692 [Halicephalobus sp. NKZ332]|nr:hypothetical protein FO519_005692 [Halicephalobus sp. NKZ332]
MVRTCPQCGGASFEEDPARADVVCTTCGEVLEESGIVSEVQFAERAGGHDIIGTYVPRDRAMPSGVPGITGLTKVESREVTYQKGRSEIMKIASQLRINQNCSDTAFNFYKMCVSRNFTRGRTRKIVVAACLYMTCRIENTPHLLLDFSDATEVNVYELGRTLNLLTRFLNIHLPMTDPCLYVLRFAIMLEFGDKQKQVVTLATRIVQRMKQDWMATGRRPTGLCGAALLLSARANGFVRSISDVVKVVHISDTVIRKRLDEFASTPSGGLTVEDFQNVELEACEDPPAFQESRRKTREAKRKQEEIEAQNLVKGIAPVQKEIESALKEKFKRSKTAMEVTGSLGLDEIPEMQGEAASILRSDVIDTVYDIAEEDCFDDEATSSRYILGPTAESLGITKPDDTFEAPTTGEEEILNDNDFGDISDGEIESYILSETEAKFKSEKKRIATKKESVRAASYQDAMKHVIKEKNLSSKINYKVLAELE